MLRWDKLKARSRHVDQIRKTPNDTTILAMHERIHYFRAFTSSFKLRETHVGVQKCNNWIAISNVKDAEYTL